ncbi:MAG: hypothetical protein ACKOZT_05170 [Cyanobium sp.]
MMHPWSKPCKPCGACAHSTTTATLGDHADRLAEAYAAARANALWAPLERILQEQGGSEPGQAPLDPALRDYILLITILVAFLEAAAQQIRPYQPPLVMRFSGISP